MLRSCVEGINGYLKDASGKYIGLPASGKAYGNAARGRPHLREHVPEDPPGETPGHGAPYGTSAARRERITIPLDPQGPTPATPPLLESVDGAHDCYSTDQVASSVDTFIQRWRDRGSHGPPVARASATCVATGTMPQANLTERRATESLVRAAVDTMHRGVGPDPLCQPPVRQVLSPNQ
jgi:hypothetical protein